MTALFVTATTGTSTGAVNAMHDSFTPLAGLVPMFNLLAGCIWPGGVGAGLYGFLVVAIIAVFVAGLMVGRTPEYLGKKIEAREMKLAMLAVLIYPLGRARFRRRLGAPARRRSTASATRVRTASPRSSTLSPRPTPTTARPSPASTAIRSGSTRRSASRCSSAASPMSSRCWRSPGSLAAKKKAPASAGTFPTDGPLFVGLLIGVIVILYLLQYFPALLARAGRRALPDARRQDLLNGGP